MAKDWGDSPFDNLAVLDQRMLAGRSPVADQLELVRELIADLRASMAHAVQGPGGLQEVARLAADAAGVPIVIAVPDMDTVLAPRTRETFHERSLWEHWARNRVQGATPATPQPVALELPVRHGGRTAGYVVAMADGDDELAIEFADSSITIDPLTPWVLDVTASAVTLAVAVDDSRMETEHRLRGSFLEQLRSGERLADGEIIKRAARLGCHLADGAVMLVVEAEGGRPGLISLTISDEYPGAFVEPIDPPSGGPVQVWAILPGGVAGADAAQDAAKRLATRLRQYGPVGLSRFHADAADFTMALDEAELMLDVMRKAALPPGDETVEGTYKLLFRLLASHPDELQTFHTRTLGPLVAHDAQYRTELIGTLEVYLDTNCNMNLTADAVFAHRHTVAHRLERIRELTGLDPTTNEDREQLGLGLKIHRLTA